MPSHCVVPKCRSNYEDGIKASVFRFPVDEAMKRKWIAAIPRQNWKVSNSSRVCEVHFKGSEIRTESTAFNEKTGEWITVKLSTKRLHENAVPSIFPGCPNYLNNDQRIRECPEHRRVRMENQQLHLALSESLKSKEDEDAKFLFSSYFNFLLCLDKITVPCNWNVIRRENFVIFFYFKSEVPYDVKCSVVMNENLEVSAYIGGTELNFFDKVTFPIKIHDVREIFKILEYVSNLTDGKVSNFGKLISLAVQNLLNNLKSYFNEKEAIINFVSEQIKLLSCETVTRRYSPETLIFCTLLYSVSPHAYNFLRHSGNLIIPHPKTIQKISSGYHADPHYEQCDANFLKYAKEKICTINDHEKIITLMLDEIHIKEYFDYKSGNIVGMAFDSNEAASSAHVFMIRSMLSSYKDVVHILPVKSLSGESLYCVIKKIIIGLERIGFFVISIVSDNNSLNRKAVSFFSTPPSISIVYKHPNGEDRPLFFVIDSVHILKCVRNNWLNQKNDGQCMFYPDFETFEEKVEIKTASFNTLRKVYEIEKHQLVTFNRSLNFKALNPSSLERQRVKLVLDVFNNFVVNALQDLGSKHSLHHSIDTSRYIEVILNWWCIVNVKTVKKGERYRNEYMKPLTLQPGDKSITYLNKFICWLDAWQKFGCTSGTFTKETHLAISHTTHALLEMAKYCIQELGFKYFLCGKVQTDALEERFSKYRYLAGSQYFISVRQLYECESKLRLQNSISLKVVSNSFGSIPVETVNIPDSWEEMEGYTEENQNFNIDDDELDADDNILPVLTYLTGYCVYAVCKHLKCSLCNDNLTLDKNLPSNDDMYRMISGLDRGALKLPTPEAVIIVHYCYAIIKKLLSAEHEMKFLKLVNQRSFVTAIAFRIISNKEFFYSLHSCCSHTLETVVKKILWISCNIFLKNYIVRKNDMPIKKKCQKRKIETLKSNVFNLCTQQK